MIITSLSPLPKGSVTLYGQDNIKDLIKYITLHKKMDIRIRINGSGYILLFKKGEPYDSRKPAMYMVYKFIHDDKNSGDLTSLKNIITDELHGEIFLEF